MWNVTSSKLSQKWIKSEVSKKWDEIIKWEQNEINYHKMNKHKKYIFLFFIFNISFIKLVLHSEEIFHENCL